MAASSEEYASRSVYLQFWSRQVDAAERLAKQADELAAEEAAALGHAYESVGLRP
jgi:hypothetical protein